MKCPDCGSVGNKLILTPGILHYGKLVCCKCDRFIQWVKRPKEEKSRPDWIVLPGQVIELAGVEYNVNNVDDMKDPHLVHLSNCVTAEEKTMTTWEITSILLRDATRGQEVI